MAGSSVASAIFEFLADPTSTSLTLPPMTTGQRTSVKKLVQQHPELRCESYGFGVERQLHLFKTCETEAQKEELERSCLKRSIEVMLEAVSIARSEVLQVRNTFIHIDEDAPCDKRAIQSLPRNMFRHCVLTESSERATVPEAPLPPCEPQFEPTVCTSDAEALIDQQPLLISPGALVVIEGLLQLLAFNGQSAIVQGFDKAAGRYDILVASAAAHGGCQQAKIKEENLRVVLPSICHHNRLSAYI